MNLGTTTNGEKVPHLVGLEVVLDGLRGGGGVGGGGGGRAVVDAAKAQGLLGDLLLLLIAGRQD